MSQVIFLEIYMNNEMDRTLNELFCYFQKYRIELEQQILGPKYRQVQLIDILPMFKVTNFFQIEIIQLKKYQMLIYIYKLFHIAQYCHQKNVILLIGREAKRNNFFLSSFFVSKPYFHIYFIFHYPIWTMNKTYCTPARKYKHDSDQQTVEGISAISQFTNFSHSPQAEQKIYYARQEKINLRKISNLIKREQKIKKRRILYQVLGKIMMTKYYNKKHALNKFRHLPQKQTQCKAVERRLQEQVAQKIILKSQITQQTAVLRSIINLRRMYQKKENAKQIQKKKIKNLGFSMLNCSVVIYPLQSQPNNIQKKLALLQLNQLAANKIKKVIQCFNKNSQERKIIKDLIVKIVQNRKENVRNSVKKLRLITFIYQQSIKNSKKKALEKLLVKCVERRERLLVESVKQNYERKLMDKQLSLRILSKSVHQKQLSAFFAIYRYSMKVQKQNQWLKLIAGSENSIKLEQNEKDSFESSTKIGSHKIFKRTAKPLRPLY